MSNRKQAVFMWTSIALLVCTVAFTHEKGFKEEQSKLTPKYDQSGQVKKACERFIAVN